MSAGFKHGELTEQIISVFYEVYNELGHGFLESIDEQAMIIALRARGLQVDQQVSIPVWFHGVQIGEFRADLVVEGLVILELKAVRTLDSAHEAQLLNELRATDKEVGLLFNFGTKPEFKRMAFDDSRKGSRKENGR